MGFCELKKEVFILQNSKKQIGKAERLLRKSIPPKNSHSPRLTFFFLAILFLTILLIIITVAYLRTARGDKYPPSFGDDGGTYGQKIVVEKERVIEQRIILN